MFGLLSFPGHHVELYFMLLLFLLWKSETIRMPDPIRNVNNPFGLAAAKLEWGFTYWLVMDDEGFASKEAIRGIYDGSFFDWLEQEMKKGQNKYVKWSCCGGSSRVSADVQKEVSTTFDVFTRS